MRVLRVGAIIVLASLACATQRGVPFCTADTASLPPPSEACRAEPAFRDWAKRVADQIEPSAGPLRFRVVFDGRSELSSVCAIRGVGPDQWRARVDVSQRLPELAELEPGPVCVAGTRMILNHAGATRAEIEDIRRECRRMARVNFDSEVANRRNTPGSIQVARAAREQRRCLEREQERRGELWVFVTLRPDPLVFTPTPEAVPRRTAILTCADRGRSNEQAVADGLVGVANSGPAAVECLRAQGWELVD